MMESDEPQNYNIKSDDYDKGIRALKQMWRMLVGHYPGDLAYAEEVFARYTTRFLDRVGFHSWMYKSQPNKNSKELMKMYMNEKINCDLNYGEPYGYDVNTIICYSPWGVKQYCKRQCQKNTRLWLVRPAAYNTGDIVQESVNKIE